MAFERSALSMRFSRVSLNFFIPSWRAKVYPQFLVEYFVDLVPLKIARNELLARAAFVIARLACESIKTGKGEGGREARRKGAGAYLSVDPRVLAHIVFASREIPSTKNKHENSFASCVTESQSEGVSSIGVAGGKEEVEE